VKLEDLVPVECVQKTDRPRVVMVVIAAPGMPTAGVKFADPFRIVFRIVDFLVTTRICPRDVVANNLEQIKGAYFVT
jgi:hypothetical protein